MISCDTLPRSFEILLLRTFGTGLPPGGVATILCVLGSLAGVGEPIIAMIIIPSRIKKILRYNTLFFSFLSGSNNAKPSRGICGTFDDDEVANNTVGILMKEKEKNKRCHKQRTNERKIERKKQTAFPGKKKMRERLTPFHP